MHVRRLMNGPSAWNGILASAAAALVVAGVMPHGAAAQGKTSNDGVYTDEQATRGADTYQQECAQCHLDDLLGDGIAPALIRASFSFRWSELSIGDMLVAIRTTMPQGAPASLSPQAYIDIMAYLLKANEYPTGDMELPTDQEALEAIIIAASMPDGAAAQGKTSNDGVYTDEQATRGADTYQQECAQCHLDDLLGDGIAPALIGASFSFRWSELSIGDMLVAIRTTMPQGAPASLSPQAYIDIVAYLLKANEYPTGDMELPTDQEALEAIIIAASQ